MTSNFCLLFAETVNTTVSFSFRGMRFPKVWFKSCFGLSSPFAVTDMLNLKQAIYNF